MTSDDEDEESKMDALLSPMVDGLSGALCLLVLVATVFMISSLNKIYGTTGIVQAKESEVLYNQKMIVFYNIVNLSVMTIEDFKSKVPYYLLGKRIVFNIYINEGVHDQRGVYTANVIKINQLLSFYKKPLNFRVGDSTECKGNYFCIYWEYE